MSDKPTTPTVPHVRIPKPLYDDLLRGRFTANQLKVVLCVVRFTIGHKGQANGARISRRFIAERTQIHERTVRVVVDGLTAEGVLVQVSPAAGRQPAKIALQTDASRWGVHSPAAPPLSRGGNLDNLKPYQFGEKLSASGHAHNAEDLSACGSAPLAGVDARTRYGCGHAHSEEPEVLLLNEQDRGSASDEPPLSAPNDKEQEAGTDGGPDRLTRYLAEHAAERDAERRRTARAIIGGGES